MFVRLVSRVKMFKNSITGFSAYTELAKCCLCNLNRSNNVLTNFQKDLSRVLVRSVHQVQRKTSLYDFHQSQNGKIVNFGGFELPVQYGNESITHSHLHTRKNCSLFDVSHMLQTEVYGENSIEFMESICTTDIQGLPTNGSALSLFINDDTGGILDDLIVTKTSEKSLYLVSNASRRDHDSKLLLQTQDFFRRNGKDVTVKFLEPESQSLLALQGPKAAEILQPLTDINLSNLYFMKSQVGTVCGIEGCRITRCGYTGEDGVEISVPANKSVRIVESLLETGNGLVKLAGLGARDTLRLEAGLCLYGNDIDLTTTPIQAGLAFTINKKRRERKDFPAAPIILLELLWGPYKKRVGFKSLSQGPPARHGAKIFVDGQNVGVITSGCPSPSLGYNIAMGYLKKEYNELGSKVQVEIRDKLFDMEICKMPFVPSKYYVKKKVKA